MQESTLHLLKRDDPSITSERYWKNPIVGNMEPNDYCKENISALCNNNLRQITSSLKSNGKKFCFSSSLAAHASSLPRYLKKKGEKALGIKGKGVYSQWLTKRKVSRLGYTMWLSIMWFKFTCKCKSVSNRWDIKTQRFHSEHYFLWKKYFLRSTTS